MALSADGLVLVVGAPYWEGVGTNPGGVYTYDWSGAEWVQRGSVLAPTTIMFGAALALSADGSVLVVKSYDSTYDSGFVYTYDWSGAEWVQRGSALIASDRAYGDTFGISLALSGDGLVLAVGAQRWEGGIGDQGGVYVYDWSGSAWVQRGAVLTAADAATSDYFGYGVALSRAGDVLVVGAPYRNGTAGVDQGFVYTYDRSGSAWVQRGSPLVAYDAAASDFFGNSLALANDGATLFVSAYGSNLDKGSIYVYDRSGDGWSPRDYKLTVASGTYADYFGSGIAASSNASVVAVGCRDYDWSLTDQGAVFVWDIAAAPAIFWTNFHGQREVE